MFALQSLHFLLLAEVPGKITCVHPWIFTGISVCSGYINGIIRHRRSFAHYSCNTLAKLSLWSYYHDRVAHYVLWWKDNAATAFLQNLLNSRASISNNETMLWFRDIDREGLEFSLDLLEKVFQFASCCMNCGFFSYKCDWCTWW